MVVRVSHLHYYIKQENKCDLSEPNLGTENRLVGTLHKKSKRAAYLAL